MRKLWLVGVCVLAIFVLLSGSVSANPGLFTFTTTAHFDSGSKTPLTDGNLGIETNTDNLGITVNSFELGSGKGDSFTTADADADTVKWNLHSSLIDVCATNTRVIASGVLNEDLECAVAGTSGVYGTTSITGDWDVRIKLDKTVDTGTTNQWLFSMYSATDSFCSGVTEDGVLYAIVDADLQAYTCINSVFSQIGTNSAIPSDPMWFRMTRATNTFTWYHSTDGSAWVQDEQTTSASIPNPLIPYIALFSNDLAEPTGGDWDDFHVAAGTLSSGAYRSTGIWTSANQIETGERFRHINITYSGVSVTNYITAVSLLNQAGSTVFVDNTDRTSGTSFSYTLPDVLIVGTWNVRLNLTGGGAGTGNVDSVIVYAFTPCAFGSLGAVADLLIPIMITTGLLLGLVVFFVGFFGKGRGTGNRSFADIGFIVGGLIGIVVILIITAALLPEIRLC